MRNKNPLIATAFTLIGIVLGATLNHFFAAERQEQSKLLELRSEAYFLFLSGEAALQETRDLTDSSDKVKALEHKYKESVKEARLRIGILGSAEQITALTDYFLLKPSKDVCDSTWSTDVEIYKAMRRDLLPTKEEEVVDDARLFYLLWNCLPPPLVSQTLDDKGK